MGCTQDSSLCSKIRNIGVLVVVLSLSSAHARFMPQGVSSSKLTGSYTQVMSKDVYDGKMARIGSRPPRCEWNKYCTSCGKCEAIQVPIPIGSSINRNTTGDISNYKPMGWKCKCGDFTFNP